jgi:hypothetical protein
MPHFSKDQVAVLLANPIYVEQAIRLLGANQTAGEIKTKGTHHKNDIGFSAAYSVTGTHLYQFVTGTDGNGKQRWEPKHLDHPTADRIYAKYIRNHGVKNSMELARKICLIHWKQLGELFDWEVTSELPEVEVEKKLDDRAPVSYRFTPISKKGKAVKVNIHGTKLWLPLSQIKVSGTAVTMPYWLASKKGLNPIHPDKAEVIDVTAISNNPF